MMARMRFWSCEKVIWKREHYYWRKPQRRNPMRALGEVGFPNTEKDVREMYRAERAWKEDTACTPSISPSCKCGDEWTLRIVPCSKNPCFLVPYILPKSFSVAFPSINNDSLDSFVIDNFVIIYLYDELSDDESKSRRIASPPVTSRACVQRTRT